MSTIRFPDRETERRALAFLIGRFSGRVLASGEHLVPEISLKELGEKGIPYIVQSTSEMVENRSDVEFTPDSDDDDLADRLIVINPAFRTLVAKSKASPYKPFLDDPEA
jgi:hypothetical protein